MDDNTLTGEGSDEGESLSETIAAALDDQQGEDLIADLGSAQDAAGETQEVDGQARAGDEGGAETPGDGGTVQTEETEPSSAEVRKAAETGPERDTDTADPHRQVAEALTAAVAPYQQYLTSRGVAPVQAVRVLLAAEHQLSTGTPERKAQILAQLAKDYGVEIDALYNLEDVEPVSPELTQIQQRIGGIERLIAGERQQANAQIQQNAEAQVVAFAEGKDAGGNLFRPHLEKVRVTMGRMIDKDPSLTLQAAYDSAVQADPKLRKAALAKQRAAPAAKRSQPGKAKAKPANEQTLHDTVTEAFRRDAERLGA